MSHYLDASVLVTAVTPETANVRVLDWLENTGEAALTASLWGLAETWAALATKQRRGDLTVHQLAASKEQVSAMVLASVTMMDVSDPVFSHAVELVDAQAHPLRAGDALHLSCCAQYGLILVTLDLGLARAAQSLGVETIIP